MILKHHDNDEDTAKVIFTEDEAETLVHEAAENRDNPDIEALDDRTATDQVILLLGKDVGLRVEEIANAKVENLGENSQGRYTLYIEGKNTRGGKKKPRKAWIPDHVNDRINTLLQVRGIDRNDPPEGETIIPVAESTVRWRIKEIGKQMAEITGNEDWEKLSSHDLRRRYAQYMLVEQGVNIRHVMAWGGWDNFESIKPYLSEPNEMAQDEELSRVGLR